MSLRHLTVYNRNIVKSCRGPRAWHLIDADHQIVGRLASTISKLLMGKHNPHKDPRNDVGDFVVVVNAEKVLLAGKREKLKPYYKHKGRPGTLVTTYAKDMRKKNPRHLLHHAIRGMLPKNKLRDFRLMRLKMFVGPEHEYEDRFEKGHVYSK